MTLPVLLIFHAFVVLFDDTKSKTEAPIKVKLTTLKDRTFNVVKDA